MDYNALRQKWLLEENKEFKGWDFSYLDGRIEEEKLYIKGDGVGDNSSELFCYRILPRPVDTSYFTIFKSYCTDITNINIV